MKSTKRKSYEKARNILRNNMPKSIRYGKSIILKKNKPKLNKPVDKLEE